MPKFEGLTTKEVEVRVSEGKVNQNHSNGTMTYKDILYRNIFTLFNLINICLAVLVIITGEFQNLLFIFVIICNIAIGSYQEIKSKRLLDKLTLLNRAKYQVIRNGEFVTLDEEQIVLDDLIEIKIGQQIPCDGELISGQIEVNEALITGESDILTKISGEKVTSGSFVVSGSGIFKATAVGGEAFASKIIGKAKEQRKINSELINSLNKILKVISIIILPIGIILFCKQFFLSDLSWQESINYTVAALVGMIPEGVMLLTSVTLALGAMRLAKIKTLVQSLYCIETLARVDVLCCDKTGTITKGNMQVVDVQSFVLSSTEVKAIVKQIMDALCDANATATAITDWVRNVSITDEEKLKINEKIPFSSSRKYSGIKTQDASYLLGAYDILVKQPDQKIVDLINQYSSEGKRVISLVKVTNDSKPELIAIIILADGIRKNAPETFAFFKKQEVEIKVISGDDVDTVKEIAREVGIPNWNKALNVAQITDEAELARLVDKITVFGRVLPNQKEIIVKALQKQNRVVAMTGDGVNDALALKAADCSIAMGNGSEVVKNISDIVLLDSDFGHMPSVVDEGRRVINNIKRLTSLFLVKTFFSTILAVLVILAFNQYPLEPVQLSIVSFFTIGMPATLLTLEKNVSKISKEFIKPVLLNALPGSLGSILLTLVIYMLNNLHIINISGEQLSVVSMLCLAINIYCVLIYIAKPFTKYRLIVIGSSIIAFVLFLAFIGIFLIQSRLTSLINLQVIILVLIICLVTMPLQSVIRNLLKGVLWRK